MAVVILCIALLCAVAGLYLLRVASQREAQAEAAPETVDTLFEAQPEPEPEPAPEPEPKQPRGKMSFPGALRRERRAWAEANDYEYTKSDAYLADEFSRGAAAGGAAPKDIVAGNEYGHEMLLMDIGGVGVMAMRTGATSDEVVDFRRAGFETEPSEDLLPAFEHAGFTAHATDSAVAARMHDPRVDTALENLPEEVTAVWMESEWVLAQTTKTARAQQWDAMLAPLAMLADAARVLPPRTSAAGALRPTDGDPTRLIPVPEPSFGGELRLITSGPDVDERPYIQRPDEPLVMPSRKHGEARGVVEHRAIGADEVDAIADGRERPQPEDSVARMPRNLERRSSIFGDEPSEDEPDGNRSE